MIPQKIEEVAELLLQLQNIHNSQSEIGIMKNGKIVTIEQLNRGNQFLINNGFNAKSLVTAEKCKNNLQQWLINLEITPNSKITTGSLCPKLKDTITAYYIQQGLTINEIIELIENCDNNLERLKALLEKKLANNNINYKLQPTNNEQDINFQKLSDYLELHITDDNKIELIFNKILEIAKDSTYITIATIYNNIKYEFEITEILQRGIIESLYGEKTTSIFYNHKNNILLQQKQQDDALKIKFNQLREYPHKKQKKARLERYQQKHQHYLKYFRANGLELEKKYSLVIGSQIADKTGSYFDPHTTVFADLQYADLNGDILNTIDLLHSKFTNHNKFKYIAFSHVPGLIFRSIDDTLSLMLKIYDILQPGGIVMISSGINSSCKKINSNKIFIDNILIPANFSENEIVTLNTHSIYDYETCLALLENNSHKLENPYNAVTLIARKV